MKTVKIIVDKAWSGSESRLAYWGVQKPLYNMFGSVARVFPQNGFYEVSLSVRKTKRTPKRATFLQKREGVSRYAVRGKATSLCSRHLQRFVNPNKDFYFGIKRIKE